jgi:predicted ATPase
MWSELKQYLVDLGVDARLEPEGWQAQVFAQIAERYHQLFAPRKLAGVVPLEGGTRELRFHDGHQDYRFSGLSSGEQQALLFLAYFVRQRIHRSIVLIDEVELHLHPSLQIEFLKQLPSLGDDNQFILTTHSPYVAEFFPLEAVFTFGALTPGKGR